MTKAVFVFVFNDELLLALLENLVFLLGIAQLLLDRNFIHGLDLVILFILCLAGRRRQVCIDYDSVSGVVKGVGSLGFCVIRPVLFG